ncbi:hypothetical protein NQZ68_008276 [Dissostichus eleginoides]|nr:hypothetical protein NQZ68_008276 [Dissostichus eleginoides]
MEIEKDKEFLQSRTKYVSISETDPGRIGGAILAVLLVFWSSCEFTRVLLLSDVHSDSYRLPPAVQSVPLQWILPLQA